MTRQKPPAGDTPYVVGYKKPPLATRFKKGQSGNRSGRPKRRRAGSALVEAFHEALNERVTVTNNGRVSKVTKVGSRIQAIGQQGRDG
jgi:hypothetical protein